jgi:hypothetical protein
MERVIKIAFGVIVPILLISCWPREMVETVNLVINSELDNFVQMRFFSGGLPSGKELVFRTGPGQLFRDGDTDTGVLIHEIFQADSIELIFDNQRIETHKLFYHEPAGNSLFDSSSYQRKVNTLTYTINSKNYENAELCDGLCYE